MSGAAAGPEGSKAEASERVPTWFLSALAPGTDEAGANSLLQMLTWHARDLFVRQGNAASAWAALEAGILQACACT